MNPEARKGTSSTDAVWKGAAGMAEDVRYYGKWMRDEAEKRIGHLYPKIKVTAEMAQERPDLKRYLGRKLTVIAWLWARTVKSPNPAFVGVDVPLAATFVLSTKKDKEAYIEPVPEDGGYRFIVKAGKPPESAKNGTKLARGSFRCLFSDVPIQYEYIDGEASAGRMGERLMAVVAQGERSRVYLTPTLEMEEVARSAQPRWKPDTPSRGTWASNAQGRRYGFRTFGDYFTDRQLVALTTFSDLVAEARKLVQRDAVVASMPGNGVLVRDGGVGAMAYAGAMSVYLGIGIDHLSDRSSTICSWDIGYTKIRNTFGRQAIQMTWDYAEGNIFSDSTGNFTSLLQWVEKFLKEVPTGVSGISLQMDASSQHCTDRKIVSTDPPYYDNIGYADLSDFFYVWLRRSLRSVFPDLFATLAVPKTNELVATSYRHGSKEKAEKFFLAGMTLAMQCLADQAHPAFPVTVYYAFKQSESRSDEGVASTGWETFLGAVIHAGFAVTGTWPMRTELGNRMVGMGTNALASSIVLVCRPRPADAPVSTWREFVDALKSELPDALRQMQSGNIAPVDLAQAAIGPGMAVFTRYAKVLDASGEALSVRDALALINQTLDEVLAVQEGDFDADTRWALAWFDQSGFTEGDYGVAETLSTAKNTSVAGMVEAGVLRSGAGKVRLLRPQELPEDWVPDNDTRLIAWEAVHHLVRVHDKEGEAAAASLMSKLGPNAEAARELAYRLYRICDQKNRSQEALGYNALVRSWPEVARLTQQVVRPTQGRMGLPDDR